MIRAVSLSLLLFCAAAHAERRDPANPPTAAADQLPANLRGVSVEQKLGQAVPLDLRFKDEHGQPVPLSELIGGRPTLLTLAYFECPGLCSVVLNGVTDAMNRIGSLPGHDFEALTVSINPEEGPALAAEKQATYLARLTRPLPKGAAPAWRFLTGDEREIRRLADAVGFHYQYDERHRQYSHPSVAIILTPEGKVSQYLFGIRFDPRALEAALTRAAGSRIGSPLQELVLYCFHFDVGTGRWNPRILNLMRVLGAITAAGVAALLALQLRKERAA